MTNDDRRLLLCLMIVLIFIIVDTRCRFHGMNDVVDVIERKVCFLHFLIRQLWFSNTLIIMRRRISTLSGSAIVLVAKRMIVVIPIIIACHKRTLIAQRGSRIIEGCLAKRQKLAQLQQLVFSRAHERKGIYNRLSID